MHLLPIELVEKNDIFGPLGGLLHTVAEGPEAVDFHRSNCKKLPRVEFGLSILCAMAKV